MIFYFRIPVFKLTFKSSPFEKANLKVKGVPPISRNALDHIIYVISLPLFQVIQRCPLHWKGHIDDLYFARDLVVYRVSS